MYKNIFLIIAVITLLTQCKEKTNLELKKNDLASSSVDTVKEYFVSGELRRVSLYVDSLRQDTMFEYYQSGKIRAYKLFKDGHQHGKTTVFFQSGMVKEVQYYEKDLAILGDTVFHENGKMDMIVNYQNGVKQGDMMLFDTFGVKFYHAEFDKGEIVKVKNLKSLKK